MHFHIFFYLVMKFAYDNIFSEIYNYVLYILYKRKMIGKSMAIHIYAINYIVYV